MSRRVHVRSRRPSAVQSRTIEAVKNGIEADAAQLGCTESEVIHIILSQHYGYDPLTGLQIAPPPGKPPGPAGPMSGPAGLAS
jgi:hypothetical protein